MARAIFESAIPVVSAVGHEIDFTISDFVADVRAADAERGGGNHHRRRVCQPRIRGRSTGRAAAEVRQRLEGAATEFEQLQGRLTRAHPRRRLDELSATAGRFANRPVALRETGYAKSGRWPGTIWRRGFCAVRPTQLLKQRRELLKATRHRLRELAQVHLRELAKSFRRYGSAAAFARAGAGFVARLFHYDGRGDGKVLREAAEVKAGQRLKTRLKTGEIFSRTEE